MSQKSKTGTLLFTGCWILVHFGVLLELIQTFWGLLSSTWQIIVGHCVVCVNPLLDVMQTVSSEVLDYWYWIVLTLFGILIYTMEKLRGRLPTVITWASAAHTTTMVYYFLHWLAVRTQIRSGYQSSININNSPSYHTFLNVLPYQQFFLLHLYVIVHWCELLATRAFRFAAPVVCRLCSVHCSKF